MVAGRAGPTTSRASRTGRPKRCRARQGDRYLRRAESEPEDSSLDRLTRETIRRLVTPRWKRHLERLIEKERRRGRRIHDSDGAPAGIPTALRDRFGIPVVFYDGDMPMSFPEYGGMDRASTRTTAPTRSSTTSSSRTPREARRGSSSSGARRAETVFWERIPSSSRPSPSRRTSTSSSTATATSSAGLDEADGRRAVPRRGGARLRARRARLPGRHRSGAPAR